MVIIYTTGGKLVSLHIWKRVQPLSLKEAGRQGAQRPAPVVVCTFLVQLMQSDMHKRASVQKVLDAAVLAEP